MGKRYRNGWWLEQKYHEEGWTQAEIADECGVSPTTIRTYMKRFGIETRSIEGRNHPLFGEKRSESVREQISATMTGRRLSDETRKRMAESHRGNEIPEDVREKISDSLTGLSRPQTTRRKMSESTAGESNPNWKGGYSPRYGSGWSLAREAVRESQSECEHCGHDGSERRLEVHHIVPVRLFRQSERHALRQAHVSGNLAVLCRRCHVRADSGIIELVPDIPFRPPTDNTG